MNSRPLFFEDVYEMHNYGLQINNPMHSIIKFYNNGINILACALYDIWAAEYAQLDSVEVYLHDCRYLTNVDDKQGLTAAISAALGYVVLQGWKTVDALQDFIELCQEHTFSVEIDLKGGASFQPPM